MEKTCRTCLNTSLQLIPLFTDSKLITAIEIISSIQMQEIENYPNEICEECVNKINIFYLFRQTIISSNEEIQKKLLELLLERKKDANVTFHKGTEGSAFIECNNNSSCDSGLFEDDIKIEVNEEINDKSSLNITEDDCKIFVEDTKIEMDIDDEQNQIQILNDSSKVVSVKQKAATKDCNICGKTISKSNFNVHLECHSDKPAKCNICGKLFKNKPCVRSHIFRVHKFEGATCHYCGKTYRNKYYFKEHLQKKHNNSNEEVPKGPTRVCNICGKLTVQSNLLAHLKYHVEAPVNCDICGKICRNASCLRDHVNQHKRKRLHCDHCGKTFKKMQNFKVHLQQHENIPRLRKHKCSVCEKAFYDKDTFNRHMRSHTGERPYVCEFCKKGFTSGHALKTHRRKHTNEKPYKCDLCDMAYPQKVSLVTHMKSKHSRDSKKQI